MGPRVRFEFFFPTRNQIVRSVNVRVDSLKEEYIQGRENLQRMGKFMLEMRAREEKKDESQVLRLVLIAQK